MSINPMTLIISLFILTSISFIFFYYRKHQEMEKMKRKYFTLFFENHALLKQLNAIRNDKVYEGIHLKEVQHAFDELDQSLLKLRTVCKIKTHDVEKLKKWQGLPPEDEFSQDLQASQIKISFNTNVGGGDKEESSKKEQDK